MRNEPSAGFDVECGTAEMGISIEKEETEEKQKGHCEQRREEEKSSSSSESHNCNINVLGRTDRVGKFSSTSGAISLNVTVGPRLLDCDKHRSGSEPR